MKQWISVGVGLLSWCSSALFGADKSGRWIAWSELPATCWEEAFVTGNGRQGTMIWGTLPDERITCVQEELFIRGWNRHRQTVANTASLLPKVRRLIAEGKADEADSLITTEADRQLRQMGARQRWPVIPHPAFDLRIQQIGAPTEADTSYRRQLNMENGEVSVAGKGIREEVFSSRTHQVNVIRLRATNADRLQVRLWLEETPGKKGIHFEHNLDSAFLSVVAAAQLGWLTYRACYRQDPGGYDGLAKVIPKGGQMTCDNHTLEIKDAEEILILLRVTPWESPNRCLTPHALREELGSIPADYETLLQSHADAHGRLFRSMQLDLGCVEAWQKTPIEQTLADIRQRSMTPLFMEQMHAMGRYLLISSCGKYPPPLQGIWGGSWKPMWIGGFVWDSNLNLAISAAAMSNLPECAESYCRYVESLLSGWRLNARRYLGCRGFLIAHYNDPENGYLTHFGRSFPWMCWSGGAGWNIRPFYEYAMLMGDDEMLRQRVFPLYREMAAFYEDFLVEGEDSLYHIIPSISPENAVHGTSTWLSQDATMDVAIAREVFSLLLEMGEQFGMATKERRKWQHYLSHLPSYRVNTDGALAEWIPARYPDNYNHRHLSHLYPVFPGSQLGKDKGSPHLRKAAGVALEKRFEFDTGSAHGLIHVALQAARLGDLDKIRTNLDRFSRREYVYNSLVTSHDPMHSVYNLDAVLSLPRLFMEMLVYTEPGKIELLPAWPEEYADGKLEGIRVYGGHVLNLSWQKGKLTGAVLQAHKDDMLKIVCQGQTKDIRVKGGKNYELSF